MMTSAVKQLLPRKCLQRTTEDDGV